MSGYKINVSGIASSTDKQKLEDFFTFCGKIQQIDQHVKTGTAVVTFEKSSAAKTALMLNGGVLDGATLSVTSDVQLEEDVQEDATQPLDQTHKPRAGIAAEYLAKGYKLSDSILQRAIELDRERGISQKFLGYVQAIDKTAGERALGPGQTISGKAQVLGGTVAEKAQEFSGTVSGKAQELSGTVSGKAQELSGKARDSFQSASQQARAFDEQKGISKTFFDYLQKALASPIGQRVKTFYTDTSKQVQDIHEEARRLIAAQANRRFSFHGTPAANTEPIPVPTPVN